MTVHPSTQLPWGSVLAVVAHPDDESFGLAAVVAAFVHAGARAPVQCLSRGEASAVHGVDGDLDQLRAREFATAATTHPRRGYQHVAGLPRRRTVRVRRSRLVGDVGGAVRDMGTDGLLVFDPSG